jgi:hypothetical protein
MTELRRAAQFWAVLVAMLLGTALLLAPVVEFIVIVEVVVLADHRRS